MAAKYVCMIENCHFMTEDEEEAREHMEMHDEEDRKMALISEENGKLNCKML